MMKLRLLSGSILALAACAVFAGPASANVPSSTVGSLICPAGSNTLPCGSSTPLNLEDWGGMTTGDPGEEGADYHCNNVLYVGPPEDTGTRPGTAYYTVGDPSVQTNPNGPHTGEDDCTFGDGSNSGNDSLGPNCVPSIPAGCSIVLARAVGYANSDILSANVPGCDPPVHPDRNPGCPGRADDGKSAGYIGVGRGNEGVNVDAGAKGNLP